MISKLFYVIPPFLLANNLIVLGNTTEQFNLRDTLAKEPWSFRLISYKCFPNFAVSIFSMALYLSFVETRMTVANFPIFIVILLKSYSQPSTSLVHFPQSTFKIYIATRFYCYQFFSLSFNSHYFHELSSLCPKSSTFPPLLFHFFSVSFSLPLYLFLHLFVASVPLLNLSLKFLFITLSYVIIFHLLFSCTLSSTLSVSCLFYL